MLAWMGMPVQWNPNGHRHFLAAARRAAGDARRGQRAPRVARVGACMCVRQVRGNGTLEGGGLSARAQGRGRGEGGSSCCDV